MYARIDVPKAVDLDTAIRDLRARFDKVSEVYYPQKDAKGRRGYGDFEIIDLIKKWDFVSTWCEIFENEDHPPLCEISIVNHDPKNFLKLVKELPKLLECDPEFGLMQSIYHRKEQDCYLHFHLANGFPGEYELELKIEEHARKAKAAKGDATAIEAAMRDLWEPTAKHFSDSASVTIIPQASGTKFKAQKTDAKFSVGALAKPANNCDEVIELITGWAKWNVKLPKSIKVMYWHFHGKFPESEALKIYLKFRKLVGHDAAITFTGKYRKGFKIDSVIGKFPVEGYWRFPLFRATAGKVGAHEMVSLVLTPNGNFFEYGEMDTTHVEKFKKHKNFKARYTLCRDRYGCTSGTKSLRELFDED